MKKLLMTTAAMTFAASMAFAQSQMAQDIAAALQDQGYTAIEVKVGPTQIKAEAIRGSQKREIVYDRTTGEILKDETEAVEPGDDISPGVDISTEDDTFVDGDDSSDDDDGDDNGGRGSDDDDDDDDDHGSSGHGSDDGDGDDDDDHGGHGSDDGSDDDDDHGGNSGSGSSN